MDYKNVLVPYDKSEHAKRALEAAIKLVHNEPKSSITVLSVVQQMVAPTISESDPVLGSVPTYMDYQDYEHLYDDSLTKLRAAMIEDIEQSCPNIPKDQIEYNVIAHPSAIQGIVEYCEAHDSDLIVMGRRGLGAIRGILGSVSSGILRSTDIPVLTVK